MHTELKLEGREAVSQTVPQIPTTPPDEHSTYPRHPEVSEYAPCFATLYTAIPDLRRSGIAMHLRQLQLSLRPGSCGEGEVADDVAEGLSGEESAYFCHHIVLRRHWVFVDHWHRIEGRIDIPFWLVLCEGFPFRVIADDFDVDETA